jgi:hypothetical protein
MGIPFQFRLQYGVCVAVFHLQPLPISVARPLTRAGLHETPTAADVTVGRQGVGLLQANDEKEIGNQAVCCVLDCFVQQLARYRDGGLELVQLLLDLEDSGT